MMIKIELTYQEIRAAHPTLPLRILQRLGADRQTGRALVCDGVEGQKTREAVYLNPAVAILHQLVAVAMDELLAGAEEEGGPNAGAAPHKYARLRGAVQRGKNLGAWCAFFASWCLAQVYLSFGRVGGAIRLVRDHLADVTIGDLRVGDLVAWWSVTRPRPYGHVGIVAGIGDEWVWTIEGNVDLYGSVDGVAARRLPRATLTRIDGAPLAYLGRYVAPRGEVHDGSDDEVCNDDSCA